MFTHLQRWSVLSWTLIYIIVKFTCHRVFFKCISGPVGSPSETTVGTCRPPHGSLSVFKSISGCGLSGLELAVAADGDVGGGRPRLPVFGVLAAVAGLGAAQVARGARQYVGVMAVLLTGAVGGVLRGCEGRILLQPAWEETWEISWIFHFGCNLHKQQL